MKSGIIDQEHQIIICVSHSDGIPSFIRAWGYEVTQEIYDYNPGYCCMVAIELEKTSESEYKHSGLNVIKT